MDKRILVTGGSSFLGLKFIELFSEFFNIVPTSRNDQMNPANLTDESEVHDLFENVKPDIVVHFASIVDLSLSNIKEQNILCTQNLVNEAKENNTPFVFMSSEAVHGGKDIEIVETDFYNPKSEYGESKVESEKVIINSGLPYLILRGHRFVGFLPSFFEYSRPKQFLDTIKDLREGHVVHLDSTKEFRPSLIDHIAEVIAYHIENHQDEQSILNVVIPKTTTYFDFVVDVAGVLGLPQNHIYPDGEEKYWANKSILSVEKLNNSGYPKMNYSKMLDILRNLCKI